MAEFRPREFYYHSCEARESTEERLRLPLHYYLKRGDIIALRRSLRSGADPFQTDEFGRTILDICLGEVEEIIVKGICTSFPIDDLISSVKSGQILKSRFYVEDENELWSGLYEEHEKALYKSFAEGSPNLLRPLNDAERQKYLPLPCKGYPVSHRDAGAERAMIAMEQPLEEFPVGSKKKKKKRSDKSEKDEDAESASTAVLIAVSDSLSKPLSAKVRLRLQKLIRRCRVYILLLEELCSCEDLVVETFRRREKLANLVGDSVVLRNLTMPYLYITTMRLLLEMYPHAPDGEAWRPDSPLDSRIMAGLVCRLELPGHYLLLFLSEFATNLAKFLLILPPRCVGSSSESEGDEAGDAPDFLYKPEDSVFSYLLHMAFVLDVPELFDILAASADRGALKHSQFDWKQTERDLEATPGSNRNDVLMRYISRLKKLV